MENKVEILNDGLYLAKFNKISFEENYIKVDVYVIDKGKNKKISVWYKQDKKDLLLRILNKRVVQNGLEKIEKLEKGELFDNLLKEWYLILKVEWKEWNNKNVMFKSLI